MKSPVPAMCSLNLLEVGLFVYLSYRHYVVCVAVDGEVSTNSLHGSFSVCRISKL